MRMVFLLTALSFGVIRGADLAVTVKSVDQDPVSRTVTVSYELTGGPAVVTVDIRPTGFAAPGPVRSLTGDVNRKVDGKSLYTLTWHPDKDWGTSFFDVALEAEVTAWPLSSPPDYMVVDLSVEGDNLRYYASPESFPWEGGTGNVICKTDKLVLRRIPAAGVQWMMGSPQNEAHRAQDGSETQHAVVLTNDYYMGVYEVTQRQYAHVTRATPSGWASATSQMRPVEQVRYINLRGAEPDWDWPKTGYSVSETSFMGLLREKVSGVILFDLPTEAEWEYACRAGTTTPYNNIGGGTSFADALKVAWCSGNAGGKTHDVGLLDPNGYGLYDMLGNVREWCRDHWACDIVTGQGIVQYNPVGPDTATETWTNASNGTVWSKRALRGWAWYWNQAYCRSARRDDRLGSGDTRNSIGFRVWAPVAEIGASGGMSKAMDSGVTSVKQMPGAVAVLGDADVMEYESALTACGWMAWLDFRKPTGLYLMIY